MSKFSSRISSIKQQTNEDFPRQLFLDLNSINSSRIIREPYNLSQRLPQNAYGLSNGSTTDRLQIKKQKKLNSSIKTVQLSKNISQINLHQIFLKKRKELSIIRTVSISYLGYEKRSRLLPYIIKTHPSKESYQIEEKEEQGQQIYSIKVNGEKITTVKELHKKNKLDEKQHRLTALIQANEELLMDINLKEINTDQMNLKISQMQKKLQNQNKSMFLQQDRRRKQQKIAAEQAKNQLLVRQINKMKLQQKDNIKILKSLRVEYGQTNRKKSLSSTTGI